MLNPNEQCQSVRLTASGIVRKGSGGLVGWLVASGSPTITVYDGTDATGELVLNAMACTAGTPYPCPRLLIKGCYVTIGGTGDITFFYA